MSELQVELIRIMSNPWQTRQPRAGDDQHVQDLAADIRLHGLLQIPLGRLVNTVGSPQPLPILLNEIMVAFRDRPELHVQLAFGHNRLAAFKLLAQEDPERWGKMPIRLAELDDQGMALAAWSENAARKDISPLEAAQALQRLIADFEWTQEQVAEFTGLARATVANKLRLLRLPKKLLKKLHNGDMSERQALSVLPAYELPDTVQAMISRARERNEYFATKLDDALAHPDKKASGDVREAINYAVRTVTDPLSNASEKEYGRATFPVDQEIDGVAAPACLSCENRVQGSRCGDHACYQQKQAAFERAELAFASAATGLPIISNAELSKRPYESKKLFGSERRKELQQAIERHCPNLRLHYDRSEPRQWDVRVPDYPHAAYVCVHDGDTICTCADAAEVKRQEKARQEEAGKKKETDKLRERTVKELTAALQAQDLGAWHAVLYALRSYSYGNHGDRDKVAGLDARQTLENIARETLKAAFDWTSTHVDAVTALAAWRERVGWLPAAEPAAVESMPASQVEPEPEPGLGHCGAYCSHYSRTRNQPYCELRDCETTLGAVCAAKMKTAQASTAVDPAPADVVDEEPAKLQPCNKDCVWIEELGAGRCYCDQLQAEVQPGIPCPDYEVVDLVVAALGEEEEDL